MNLNTFLLPPVTIPQNRLFRQLLLAFDEIFLYAAAEDSYHDNLYTQKHLLKHYAPLPFGADLAKFQKLINDIKGNRAEYYSGGLYSLMADKNIDEASFWQLVNGIMSPESQDDKHMKTMLDVRLIMRLAEIATAEEEEVCLELNKVNRLADSLLDDLKDETTSAPISQHSSSAVSMNISKLLRAWIYLFMEDKEVERPWIATTASLEVAEILADHYSARLDEQPLKICSLPLPDPDMDDEVFIDWREKFRQSGTVTDDLANILRTVALKGEPDAEAFRKIESAWLENIASSGKVDKNSLVYERSCTADFYFLSGVSLPEIFSRVIGEQQGVGPESFPPNSIITVIK